MPALSNWNPPHRPLEAASDDEGDVLSSAVNTAAHLAASGDYALDSVAIHQMHGPRPSIHRWP
jgi:hypothetical protein